MKRWFVTSVALALLPVLAIVLFRWLDPPTTARIVATRRARSGAPVGQQWVPLEKIAVDMQHAVIAAEDTYFEQHHGFDWNSMREAMGYNRVHSHKRGASTITQQVAKNLFLWSGRSYLRKALEAYLTVWMELLWPKRRILEVYLNIAQFGDGLYGVEAFAQRRLGKSAAELTTHECALLAAVLPNPVRYDANDPSHVVRFRQLRILKSLEARRDRGARAL